MINTATRDQPSSPQIAVSILTLICIVSFLFATFLFLSTFEVIRVVGSITNDVAAFENNVPVILFLDNVFAGQGTSFSQSSQPSAYNFIIELPNYIGLTSGFPGASIDITVGTFQRGQVLNYVKEGHQLRLETSQSSLIAQDMSELGYLNGRNIQQLVLTAIASIVCVTTGFVALRIGREKPTDNTNTFIPRRPPMIAPLPADLVSTMIVFLTDVGRFAISELKERWSARRKQGNDESTINLLDPNDINKNLPQLLETYSIKADVWAIRKARMEKLGLHQEELKQAGTDLTIAINQGLIPVVQQSMQRNDLQRKSKQLSTEIIKLLDELDFYVTIESEAPMS